MREGREGRKEGNADKRDGRSEDDFLSTNEKLFLRAADRQTDSAPSMRKAMRAKSVADWARRNSSARYISCELCLVCSIGK